MPLPYLIVVGSPIQDVNISVLDRTVKLIIALYEAYKCFEVEGLF